jgi:tetratricopeptide (TPR) repeat protein
MSIRGLRAGLLAALAALAVAAAAEPPAEPADARFNRAERLLAGGEIEKAYQLYESLAKSAPERWGARCAPRMAEIKKLLAGRDEARARAARLRQAAAAAAPGELGPWLLLESARRLFEARCYQEARAEAAGLLEKFPDSRHRPAAGLLLAGALGRLDRAGEAAAAYRAALAEKGATRAERGAAWQELAELLAGAGQAAERLDLFEEQVRRGPEEPGAPEAAERFVSLALVGPKEAVRAARLVEAVLAGWPAGAVRAEWVLTAAKVAEFVERDYPRADRLYRLVLERYPEAAFDLRLLEDGKRGADSGREVILAAVSRVEDKRAGRIRELAAPAAAERGKSPEQALAAVLAALRAGDAETAGAAAAGALAADIAAGRCEFARFGLSDCRVLGAKADGRSAEVEYEVAGELGVTRVLKKKARAEREGDAWKITGLGL